MGVVIEAKFRHHAGKNPFPNYRNFASDKWFGGRENEQLNEIAKFIILGIEPCRKTRELTTKDGALWRFVRWSDFLRKFELEVLKLKGHGTYGHPQEYNFIQLRRIIWEMI